LRSGTDTSYFPTDEIDQTDAEQPMAESGDDAKKDLAFLGYTLVIICRPFGAHTDYQVPTVRNAVGVICFVATVGLSPNLSARCARIICRYAIRRNARLSELDS
jgi:protein-serine/threonine kinase